MSKASHALPTDALCYLHSRQIVHRDIKPSNIFLHEVTPENMALKMGDFGLRYTHFDSFSLPSLPLTVFVSVTGSLSDPSSLRSASLESGKRSSRVGTPCYLAPEILMTERYDAVFFVFSTA